MPYKYLELSANNVPSDGKVSHARGYPVLSFSIGRQDAVLDMSSIRIAGKLNIWRDTAGTLHPTGGNAANLMASPKLGVYGLFDQITIRHSESKQVCEQIRHYQRFLSSYIPLLSSQQDALSHMSETSLIMNNHLSFRDSVVRNTAASSFCVPLPCGMTLGKNRVPLNSLPIDLDLSLSPDSSFFFSSSATGSLAELSDCFFELSDIKLLCEVYVPKPDELSRMLAKSGAFDFNSITSYFSTLESTNSIVNFRLGLSRVLSAFVNFIPSTFVNNLSQDGSITYMPAAVSSAAGAVASGGTLANLESITFLKNGERFPYEYNVETNFDADNNTQSADPQVIRELMSALSPDDVVRTNISPNNCNRDYVVNNNRTNGYKLIPDGGGMWGVGALYDKLDADGVDFSSEQFSIQMRNGLTDGNPNSAYLFVKSKNTMLWKDGQIQIIT